MYNQNTAEHKLNEILDKGLFEINSKSSNDFTAFRNNNYDADIHERPDNIKPYVNLIDPKHSFSEFPPETKIEELRVSNDNARQSRFEAPKSSALRQVLNDLKCNSRDSSMGSYISNTVLQNTNNRSIRDSTKLEASGYGNYIRNDYNVSSYNRQENNRGENQMEDTEIEPNRRSGCKRDNSRGSLGSIGSVAYENLDFGDVKYEIKTLQSKIDGLEKKLCKSVFH